jgi:hypothetical protein
LDQAGDSKINPNPKRIKDFHFSIVFPSVVWLGIRKICEAAFLKVLKWWPGMSWMQRASNGPWPGVHAAYYLVHSLGAVRNFEDLKEKGVRNFGLAAQKA